MTGKENSECKPSGLRVLLELDQGEEARDV